MGLSIQQLTRLGQLLDQSLPLSPAARRAWLAALPGEDQPLVHTLREALQADDPATVLDDRLERPPRVAEDAAADAPGAQRQPGERLGAYELLRPLGTGGMAEVWLARRADGAFERQVALKIPRLRDEPAEMAARFARECRILATLEYPGIARLYDAGVDASGVPYIAMEYVEGEPLTAWCDARRLGAPDRVRVFLQVLDAVDYAHARQVLHRDLKPSNILVTPQGEARLLDFGVARLLQATAEAPALTRSFGRALTPEYASPELLRGEPIDVRSDVYSLGVVLHELLTGSRPAIAGPASGEAVRALPAHLRAALEKALAPLPADRFASASEFARALRSAHAGLSAGLRRVPLRYAVPLLLLATGAATLLLQGRREGNGETVAALVPGATAPEEAAPAATAPPATAPSTIAVLPFTDLSEAADQRFLSDGLAEELLSLLTRIPELRVTASASSFAFRDRRSDIPAIARQLNVANIIDGSVRKSGNRLRVAVQLVQASTGTVVWSETFDRELQDVFQLQEDVAGAVVDALKLRLLAEQHIPPGERTANVAAYEQFLQGLQLREGDTIDDKRRAIAAFERALALDPGFARAHAGIAIVAVDIGGRTVDRAMYELARGRAERAIALAPTLASGYIARAFVRMHNDWDFSGARADIDQALAVEPNSMGVQQLLTTFLLVTGQQQQALALQKRVVERNPVAAPAWLRLAELHMAVRDYDGARAAFARAEALKADARSVQHVRALLELYAGRTTEALQLARQVQDPRYRDYAVAMTAWSAGARAEADAALQRLVAEVPDVYAAQISMVYAWRGDREQAFRWMAHALDLRDAGLLDIHTRPEFDRYRDDPRFRDALQRMNLAS